MEKYVPALEKDIEILTSMKMLTMINEETDKKLSSKEKDKVKKEISAVILQDYEKYKLIYKDNVFVGAFLCMPYKDGVILDQIFVFKEHRRKGIATRVLELLKKENKLLYTWAFKDDKVVSNMFLKNGFSILQSTGRTLMLQLDVVTKEINTLMSSIRLGYRCQNGEFNFFYSPMFRKEYYLQNASLMKDSKMGLCFDQVELERDFFMSYDIEVFSYFLYYSDLEYSHAFLVYKRGDMFYWFENAWKKYKGIRVYKTEKDLLNDVRNKFFETISDGEMSRLKLYLYKKPRVGSNYSQLLKHILSSTLITFE